jgi:DNA polymerase-3 subunit delta
MNEASRLIEEMQGNRYAPVYFLHGDEPYYIDLVSDYIEEHAVPESEKGLNQLVVYGKDVKMQDILSNARKYPMMSERQVVLVKEAQNIIDFNKEEADKLLTQYLSNPQPSTILVFCYKYKTLDSRRKITGEIKKHAVVLAAKKLYDNQVPGWIRQYTEDKDYKITEKAVQMLLENIGNDLTRISHEIDKICLNISSESEIDDTVVQRYVGISKEYNAFELQKAIVQRDVLKAYKIVAYFDANPKNNPIIPVIGILYSLFSKLLIVHDQGLSNDKNIAKVLRINPYFAAEYRTGAQHYSIPRVLRNIRYLRHADLQCKGVGNTSFTDGQILKELVYKLMH